MYEARSVLQKILKLTFERAKLSKLVKKQIKPSESQAVEKEQKADLARLRKMGARVTSMINSLQEEHRILRRPFILAGKDYLLQVTEEMKAMD